MKRILIVDDEPDLRAIARLSLENAGYATLEAENGKRGIEVLKENKPDLVLLDLMMPTMNGIEFCHCMIEDLEMLDVPVLVLSAVNEKAGIVRQFFDLPLKGHGFITKPLEPQRVLDKVKELIGEAEPKPAQSPPMPAAPATPPSESAVRPPRPKARPASTARVEPGKAPTATPSADTYTGARLKVLVIDDEEDMRLLVRAALSLHHEVETAENGMDALDRIEEVNPDFVISDINMPVMNGLETVEAIRRHPRFGSIPVFFLTAEEDASLPRRSFDIGGNLFLRKPIDPMRLLMLVDRFIAEMGMTPKTATESPPEKPPKKESRPEPISAPPQAPGEAVAGLTRVLAVDYNVEDVALLKNLFAEKGKGRWEWLWADDARAALGNLTRWEPDVILYNPRNPGLDGIAFNQTLRLKKLDRKFERAFIGSNFFEADLEYSKRVFGRDVIRLDQDEGVILAKILKVIEAARAKVVRKSKSVEDIEEEDREFRDEVRAKRNLTELQRSIFRDKFSRMQEFIDGRE